MSARSFRISAIILAAVIAALAWLNISVKPRTPWDTCHEMANSRIEWSGAGYNGIYGRQGK